MNVTKPTRWFVRIALVFVVLSADNSRAEPADRNTLLLTNARVLDLMGDRWLEGRAVLIENGRIVSVAPVAQTKAPAGAKTIDLSGLYLLPGLMDLHTHLLLHPYNEAPWNDQVLKESLELRTIRAVAAGRATLEAGFTTIRDLGTEGAANADVALRDAFAAGLTPGPRVLTTTRAIVATGCYGPQGFDPRWDVPYGADQATGVDECRRVVRKQIAAGADWIKFYADYHRRAGAPVTPTFTVEEMKEIVDEAKSAGLRVAAHATTSEGIRRAVHAGVATIEHGYEASDEVLKLMIERGVSLCPTLAAAEAYARYQGWKPGTPPPEDLRRSQETFARAVKLGVRIACGSDAGVFAHGENARELELMVAGGMTPAAALRAATTTAASVIDREKDVGRIDAGYLADLIVVRGDPLKDVGALRKPLMVLKDGKVAIDRR
ncbi:MAG TPA: amidohydrolase family protein [Phycisphaerae bacterium]|nr:amidohydrolase family protein [Phycisphaerae bacterium]